MQPALTAAKLSGTEAAAILGMKAKSTQVVEQAQSWKAQAMEASRDANILGAVLGVLGMGTSLILGTLEFCNCYFKLFCGNRYLCGHKSRKYPDLPQFRCYAAYHSG